MKNIAYIILIFGFSIFSKAQIGIGNSNPRGILEINKSDGTDFMGLVLPSVPSVIVDTLDVSVPVTRRYIPSVVKPTAPFSELNYTVNMEGQEIKMKKFVPTDPSSAAAPMGTIVFDQSKNCVRVNNSTTALGNWQDCIVDKQDVNDYLNYKMYGAENFKLKKASAGYYFTIGVGFDDFLYSAGYGGYYATGTGTGTGGYGTWKRIFNIEKIKDVRAGYFNGFAITQTGKLLGWGYNYWGMLGDPTSLSRTVTSPKYITVSDNTSGVKEIAAGYSHTLLLMNDGSVYASGYNGYGATGVGTTSGYITQWTKLNFTGLPSEAKIVDIDVSALSSAAVDSAGNLYTWGHSAYGASGWGTTGYVSAPQKHTSLSSGTKITKVAINPYAGLALGIDIDGKTVLYQWGLKYIIANTGYVATPTLVPQSNFSSLEADEKIVEIFGSVYYPTDGVAYYLTNKNNLYAAGSYSFGKLGTVNFENGNLDTNTYNKGYLTKVYELNFFDNMSVTGLSSGATHTVFTTGENLQNPSESYTAYGTGDNTYNEQGEKNPTGNIFKPVKK